MSLLTTPQKNLPQFRIQTFHECQLWINVESYFMRCGNGMSSNKNPKIQKHKTGFSTLKKFFSFCLCKIFIGNVKGCHKIKDRLSFVFGS